MMDLGAGLDIAELRTVIDAEGFFFPWPFYVQKRKKNLFRFIPVSSKQLLDRGKRQHQSALGTQGLFSEFFLLDCYALLF